MARMPGAVWVGEQSPRRRMSRYDVVCIHTIVGYAPAHAAHFSVKRDGTILQSRDTAYQSAANLNGNPRVIAIENEDAGEWWKPLTPAQVESNAQILAWAHRRHGVRLQLCPNSRPRSKGLAYHRQGIDGNFGSYRFPGRVTFGQRWSKHFGKVCPGDNKIAQRPQILARAKQIVNPEPKEWDEMATKKEIEEVVESVVERAFRRHRRQLTKANGFGERLRQFIFNADLTPNVDDGKSSARNVLRGDDDLGE